MKKEQLANYSVTVNGEPAIYDAETGDVRWKRAIGYLVYNVEEHHSGNWVPRAGGVMWWNIDGKEIVFNPPTQPMTHRRLLELAQGVTNHNDTVHLSQSDVVMLCAAYEHLFSRWKNGGKAGTCHAEMEAPGRHPVLCGLPHGHPGWHESATGKHAWPA